MADFKERLEEIKKELHGGTVAAVFSAEHRYNELCQDLMAAFEAGDRMLGQAGQEIENLKAENERLWAEIPLPRS